MKTKRIACGVAVLAGLTLGLIGCKEQSGKRQIAVIPKGTTHTHWKGVEEGAQKAAKEFGVEVIWKGPIKEDDRAEQIKVVQQFTADGVAGICLAPLDDKALVPSVQAAVAKKIPVLMFDSGLQGEAGKDFVSLVATDNKRGGYLGGQQLAKVLGGKGKVVLLRYQENSASTEQREAGFIDAMKEAPGITLIDTKSYAGPTRDTAKTKALNMADQLKEADGIFCPNESSTYGMLLALRQLGLAGKVKFVGFDAPKELVDAVESDEIQGLVAQNPLKMGYETVKAMVQQLDGKKVEPFIDTGAVVVTKESLKDPEVKKLLNR